MSIRFVALALVAALLGGCSALIPDRVWDEGVREAVRANPDIVFEALADNPEALLAIAERGVKARRARRVEDEFRAALDTPLSPVVDESRPMRGNPQAPVTVVAYSHFLCGFCARGAMDLRDIMHRRPDAVRYVVKHAPTSEAGEYGARLFEALGLQGEDKAWEFYYAAFEQQAEILDSAKPSDTLREMALAVEGVDAERLDRDADSEALRELVRQDVREFQAFGFNGVPVYLFNGAPVQGSMPVEFFEKALDIVLGRLSPDEFTAQEVGACIDCLNK